MKLSTLPIVAAAAGLATAAPISIDLSGGKFSNGDSLNAWSQNVRWGHAAAGAFSNFPALENPRPTPTMPWADWKPRYTTPAASWVYPNTINPTWPAPTAHPTGTYLPEDTPFPTPYPTMIREYNEYGEYYRYAAPQPPRSPMRGGGCRGRGGMRAKSMEIGNKLRVILGLPPIQNYPYRHGSTVIVVEALPRLTVAPTHHRHHMRPHQVNTPFTMRLARALSMLGPWEGRAVSFVLGCGVGVLLRMLFVFGVLIVRASRTRRAEAEGRIVLADDSVIFVAEDIKEPVVAETLPEYAEKVEEAPQTNNVH